MNETRASSPRRAESFSAAQAVAATADFAELRVGPGGLYYNEFRPEDARCRIWRWRDGDKPRCLTPEGFSVRSRVYEYGGGAFCLGPDWLVFVNEADQQLYRQPLDGGDPVALTRGERRHGDLRQGRGVVLAVEETHAEGAVEHRLVAIGLEGGERLVLAEGADFYAAPVQSADGERLAWIEWQRPQQPWTRTRLCTLRRQADGGYGDPRCVAGDGEQAESLQQPRFTADGRLGCLSDRNGYWQPWMETADGWAALTAMPADHAPAPWQGSASTWAPLDGERYLATWFEDGFGRLSLCEEEDRPRDFSCGYTRFRGLDLDTRYFYAIVASSISAPAVLAIDRQTRGAQVIAGGESPLPAECISLPRPIHYPSGGEIAHGFFYPACGEDSRPPLVVFIHGGPTSACYPVLDARIQYWTQRGFAVADLNYRGSSNHGRAYREKLHEQWGVVDVEDACAVVGYLAEQGLVDGGKAFIRGGSAGGYTTLCALAFHKVFRGGASLYGVSDPLALGRVTHKFEGDYLDWLIGDPERDAERYHARTPLSHADRIEVPVIFFQGELDAVVVPRQTRDMLQALRSRGVQAEGHFYPQERHGLRQAANLAHALDAEWRFYRHILNASR
ncbi:Coenzyme PQQ synthesis protein F [Cystobacter fuscus DSM 2262]|uniref:Coenzyme PQQ synthesis protein F n=1 Tax=Cystobacter fuscus (strain ATCC 25194 / DSM 2262 / NBRC 100088 / M29) TaxID=1242864 RepID=S9P552_CYSF2|nr:prolyl oligopeptidase family serine peptidase [Cystobacter fuscus]EPX59560.1 Coenzyme PQQ synthesis protein F [Cystobacter fuscus DSM 2262]